MILGFFASGISRTISTLSRPFSRPAPMIFTWSVRLNRRSKARSAMPRCRYYRSLGSSSRTILPAIVSSIYFTFTVIPVSPNPATAIVMRYPSSFNILILSGGYRGAGSRFILSSFSPFRRNRQMNETRDSNQSYALPYPPYKRHGMKEFAFMTELLWIMTRNPK